VLEGCKLLSRDLAAHLGILGLLQVGQHILLGLSALVVAVLLGMHGKLEELLIVLAIVPSVLVHLLLEVVQSGLQQGMRIDVGKLIAFLFGQLLQLGSDLAWHLTAAAEDHAPHGIVHIDITALALLHREQVHQRDVLGILREWCHQWWIAHTRPYVSNLVE